MLYLLLSLIIISALILIAQKKMDVESIKAEFLCKKILEYRLAFGTHAFFEDIISKTLDDYRKYYPMDDMMKRQFINNIKEFDSEALAERQTCPVVMNILKYESLCKMTSKHGLTNSLLEHAKDSERIEQCVTRAYQKVASRFQKKYNF